MSEQRASLPTYRTIADVLEKKNGSGLRLLGWTLARAGLIAVPLWVVNIPTKKVIAGALLSSALISTLTLVRIYNAGYEQSAADDTRRRLTSWYRSTAGRRAALKGAWVGARPPQARRPRQLPR